MHTSDIHEHAREPAIVDPADRLIHHAEPRENQRPFIFRVAPEM